MQFMGDWAKGEFASAGPTPLYPALTSITEHLEQALADVNAVDSGISLAVNVLGGSR